MFIFDPKHKETHRPVEYPWVLLLLAFVWLWPGIVHRDLWNSESTVYATILSIQQHNNLFYLDTYGQIQINSMPIYVWIANIFHHLSSVFPMSGYTAARLATTLLISIGLLAMGVAGRQLLGKYHGRSVVLLLLACPGTIVLGHTLDNTVMQFTAFCLFILAITMSRRNAIIGGVLLSLSWLFAFWAGNLPPFIFLLCINLLLPCAFEWRTRRYLRSIALAFLMGLPLLLLLPLLLKQYNPVAFDLWLNYHIFGFLGGIKDVHISFSTLKIIKNLLWFALPAWLIALWTIYRRKILSQATGWFCLLWIILATLILSFSTQSNHQLFWFLPPFALIAAAGLDDIKRGIASFFNWFGVMIFGSAAIFLWCLFFAINYGVPYRIAEWASRFNPYFSPDWNYFPMILALSFTPIWLWAVTRRHIRGRQAVTNWVAGSTLIWTIIFSLFLPWTESLKSYRPIAKDMVSNIQPTLRQQFQSGEECIDSNNIALLTALDEFDHIARLYHTNNNKTQCRYRIASYSHYELAANAKILWQGTRGKHSYETIVLMDIVNSDPKQTNQ